MNVNIVLAPVHRAESWMKDYLGTLRKTDEASQAVEQLIQGSRLEVRFFVMSLLSGLMAAVGLLIQDIAVLIGAMVLAPLLNPVLALSAGLLLMHSKLITYAIKSLAGGILGVVVTTAFFSKMLLLWDKTVDLTFFPEKFASPDAFFFFLVAAFISGFAAIYSWLRPLSSLNLVGIAIAVSLIPFLSFLGLLLGAGHYDLLGTYSILFGFNLLSLIFGSVLAFLLLGFSENDRKIDHEIEKAAR